MSRKTFLSSIASVSTDVLAVVGVVALMYGALAAFDEGVEKIFPAPDLNVRPVCEQLTTKHVMYADDSPAKVKLIGLDIKANKDTPDARFSIEGIDYILSWSIDSDSFSEEEASSLLATLPKGNVRGQRIFGNFPRMLNGTETILHASAVMPTHFDCKDEWFNVSSSTSNVIQLNYTGMYAMRGWEWRGPSFEKILLWGLTLPIAIYALYLRHRLREREVRKARL